MAVDSLTLLQVVALILPVIAVLMQMIFRIQSNNTDRSVELFAEFRALEIVLIFLILSASAFSFEIAQEIDSDIKLGGLILMTVGLMLVVPATAFGIRRGMSKQQPEVRLISVLERVTKPVVFIILVIASVASASLFYLYVPQIGQLAQYVSLISVVICISSMFMLVSNYFVSKRLKQARDKEVKSSLEKHTDVISESISNYNNPNAALLDVPQLRSTIQRRLDSILEIVESSSMFAPDTARSVDATLDKFESAPELSARYHKASEYVQSVDEVIDTLQNEKQELDREIEHIKQQIDVQLDSGSSVDKEELSKLKLDLTHLEEQRKERSTEIQRYKSQQQQAIQTKKDALSQAEDLLEDVTELVDSLENYVE